MLGFIKQKGEKNEQNGYADLRQSLFNIKTSTRSLCGFNGLRLRKEKGWAWFFNKPTYHRSFNQKFEEEIEG